MNDPCESVQSSTLPADLSAKAKMSIKNTKKVCVCTLKKKVEISIHN